MKSNGHWVKEASAEVNDKVNELVAEQTQEMEEGTDVDAIVYAAFVKIVGEKSGYCRGRGSGVRPVSRRSMDGIQEKLQKEVEEERQKRESVESKLMEVQNQLEEERKNREVVEARLSRETKNIKKGLLALVSHMNSSKEIGLPVSILDMITNSSGSDEASSTSLIDDIMDEYA